MKFSECKSKAVSYILKHRIELFIIVIIAYISFTLILYYKFPCTGGDTITSLEKLALSAEIISMLFIAVSAVVAVFQYYISCRNEKIKSNTEKIQKSIELTAFYKDHILDKLSVICLIFNDSGITNILDCINKNEMINFDEHELKQLLTKSQRDSLKSAQFSPKFIKSIAFADKTFNLKLTGIDSQNIDENKSKIAMAFMSNYIVDTLNNLEYFAMHFTHNIADESVIFQSIHPTYLQITELLYYTIAEKNTPNNPKFFTNLIDLHNIWKKKQNEQNKELVKTQRGVVAKGSFAETITE